MKIYTTHFRNLNAKNEKMALYPASFLRKEHLSFRIKSFGGATRVKIVDDSGVVGIGYAFCKPEDNFNRKIGYDIALANAKADYDQKFREPIDEQPEQLDESVEVIKNLYKKANPFLSILFPQLLHSEEKFNTFLDKYAPKKRTPEVSDPEDNNELRKKIAHNKIKRYLHKDFHVILDS